MTNEEAVKKYNDLMTYVKDNDAVIQRIRHDSLELARFCVEYDRKWESDWECVGCPFDKSTDTKSNVCIMKLPFDYELGDCSSWVQAVFENDRMKRKN